MKRILIADDESALRFLISESLKLDGDQFEIFEAVDGEDALHKIHQLNPDLVLLDVSMPKINGYEILEQVRQGDRPETKIILLTGRVYEEEVQKGMSLGADLYLEKPFSPLTLLAHVEQMLNR